MPSNIFSRRYAAELFVDIDAAESRFVGVVLQIGELDRRRNRVALYRPHIVDVIGFGVVRQKL